VIDAPSAIIGSPQVNHAAQSAGGRILGRRLHDESQGNRLTLLTIIAAALVANIILDGRPAVAQYGGPAGPTEPVVVSGAFEPASSNLWYAVRFWSDGQVDRSLIGLGGTCSTEVQCEPAVLIPGACSSDVNRDGFVATEDLLGVLADWGTCR
jgi:hypothetical protein